MTRVLLVDDDESNRLTLAAVLEDEGYEVTDVSTADEAERLADADATFDLAVLDQHIGAALGTDLAGALRRRMPAVRVVLLSGSVLERPEAAVLDAFLTKGCEISLVLSTLRGLVPAPAG